MPNQFSKSFAPKEEQSWTIVIWVLSNYVAKAKVKSILP
jgi:hypothetical protein